MKHIRNLWNLLKQEISLWKYEKQELVKGICYIVMIAWLFFDRIAFAILLIPYLFVFMKQQRIHKVHREKEKLRKEFREMMISIGNSLSAGYSIENALKTAKNDLEMYEEHSLLAKELQLLINKLKMNVFPHAGEIRGISFCGVADGPGIPGESRGQAAF